MDEELAKALKETLGIDIEAIKRMFEDGEIEKWHKNRRNER